MDKLVKPAARDAGGPRRKRPYYLIFSFFDWQQVSIGPLSVGASEWHGVGVVAGLVVIVVPRGRWCGSWA